MPTMPSPPSGRGGRGATATVWFAAAAIVGRTHRVYALDQIGAPGRSIHDGRAITSTGDLMDWLDGVLDQLGLGHIGLCGHSYGAYLALHYALHAPDRISRLALLDPTDCFGKPTLTYRLHAVPLFVRGTPERMRSFLAWETGHGSLDPAWLEAVTLGTTVPAAKVVMPRPPDDQALGALNTPTLVLLAERGRATKVDGVSATARRLLPHVTTAVLPGATHHTIPTERAEDLSRHLVTFLA